MVEETYKKGISETLVIIEHSGLEYIEKIPKKLMNFLKQNASTEYKPKLDFSKKIGEMNLLPETKGLLSVLYMDYWSTPDEKEEFKKILASNQQSIDKEIREKYNPDKIFENSNSVKVENVTKNESNIEKMENNVNDNESIVPYKESFIKNLIERVKQFINKFFNKNS